MTHHALLLSFLGAIWFCLAGTVIILQRRSAAATLAWLFAWSFLPVVGLIAYRLIGPLRLERKQPQARASRSAIGEAAGAMAALDAAGEDDRSSRRVRSRSASRRRCARTASRSTSTARSTYEAILAAVAAARAPRPPRVLHLGARHDRHRGCATRSIERARAGVKVRMLVDGDRLEQASSKKFLAPLRAAGVEVARFNPVRLRSLRLRRPDFRTHRKIVVCDGRVGFTGGMNITDAHSAQLEPGLLARHPPADRRAPPCGRCSACSSRTGTSRPSSCARSTRDTFPTPPQRRATHLVQIVGSGPDSDAFAIHKVLFTAINQCDRSAAG